MTKRKQHHMEASETDRQMLRALVRLLARQAAAEYVEASVASKDAAP